MGIALIIGAVAAAASVATGFMQMSAAKKANAERREANNIQTAQQKNEGVESRRKAVREARVRRAMIMQGSVNAGLGTSGSGTLGAAGAITSNLGGAAAFASGQTKAIEGINARNQRAADYAYKAARIGAFGNIFQSALGAFQTPSKQ